MRSFEEVRSLLNSRIEDVLVYLVPGGKMRGNEYQAASPHGGKGKSFSFNTKKCIGTDFAGESIGDVIALWASAKGMKMWEAKQDAEDWLGLPKQPHPESIKKQAKTTSPEMAPDEDQQWYREVDGNGKLKWLAAKWDYITVDGEYFASVYRFEHPSLPKAIRPWDPKALAWKWPAGKRPLLYTEEISAAPADAFITITEGEKDADSIRELGFLATTIGGGSNAIEQSDYSILEHRHVIVWRDKDTAGRKQEEALLAKLRDIGVASARVVQPPKEAPPKWGAADASIEDRLKIYDEGKSSAPVIMGRVQLRLVDWTARSYRGEPDERRYLVRGSIPIGSPSLLAGQGGIGKGLALLELAFKCAFGRSGPRIDFSGNPNSLENPQWLGGSLNEFGRVVLIAGEDTADELHNRLITLDPTRQYEKDPDRIMLVPLPNAGGNFPLVRGTSKGPEVTDEFASLRDQLYAINDLKLIILDPLSRFAAANIEREIDSSQMLFGALGSLAAELECACVVSHHMSKARGNREAKIVDAETARDAIRGSTGLVDATRLTYALWAETDFEHVEKMCSAVGRTAHGDDGWRTRIVRGAVVKANVPHDPTLRTFMREKTGMLRDITTDVRSLEGAEGGESKKTYQKKGKKEEPKHSMDDLFDVQQLVKKFSEASVKVTITGDTGLCGDVWPFLKGKFKKGGLLTQSKWKQLLEAAVNEKYVQRTSGGVLFVDNDKTDLSNAKYFKPMEKDALKVFLDG